MFDQAIVRTGIKFGVICALAGFAVIFILYFAGFNPYGEYSRLGWLFIPVAVFWGIWFYKRHNNPELGFLKALKVGWSVAFYSALCSAMLLFVFSVIIGIEPIERHIVEMKALLKETHDQVMQLDNQSKKSGFEAAYQQAYRDLDNTTPADLAIDDFVKKIVVGVLAALVGAVFFRK